MRKSDFPSLRKKNEVIDNIIEALVNRQSFLILGHRNPDEDCVSAMTAFALLVGKFQKNSRVYFGARIHEHFGYLLSICRYNSIEVYDSPDAVPGKMDTIVICDTPKPDMIQMNEPIARLMEDPDVLKIEVDHHLGGDSTCCGDEGYCLVTQASSASELIGQLALKLSDREELLAAAGVSDIFSRNFTLAVLSGIIGDSQMGQFLKSRKEKRYYQLFSTMFNELLERQTTKGSNFANKEEVFRELQRLSSREVQCYQFLSDRRRKLPSFSAIVLDARQVKEVLSICDLDTFISMSRAVVNDLAEESRRFGLIAYPDPEQGEVIQFRIRRSREYRGYDLRTVLNLFHIENGGGHEGAIGFRIPADSVGNLEEYVRKLSRGVAAGRIRR